MHLGPVGYTVYPTQPLVDSGGAAAPATADHPVPAIAGRGPRGHPFRSDRPNRHGMDPDPRTGGGTTRSEGASDGSRHTERWFAEASPLMVVDPGFRVRRRVRPPPGFSPAMSVRRGLAARSAPPQRRGRRRRATKGNGKRMVRCGHLPEPTVSGRAWRLPLRPAMRRGLPASVVDRSGARRSGRPGFSWRCACRPRSWIASRRSGSRSPNGR